MTDIAIVAAAVSIAVFACALASEFWAAYFRWKNRRDNERWLKAHADYFDDWDELEELLRY